MRRNGDDEGDGAAEAPPFCPDVLPDRGLADGRPEVAMPEHRPRSQTE